MATDAATLALPGGRRPPAGARHARLAPGPLTWAAAAAIGAGTVGGAALSGDGRAFFGAAACVALVTLLAMRPLAGAIAILLVRPTLDVWADKPLATLGGFEVNAASVLALMLIPVGGVLVAERFDLARRSPALLPFALFAVVAGAGIAIAPNPTAATTEWLRLLSVLVIYAVTFVAVRTRRDLGVLVVALLLSAVPPIVAGVVQTAQGGSTVIADFGRATGTFLHPDPYGIFMAIVLAFAAAIALRDRLPGRLWVLAGGSLGMVALLGSYTRNGWFGLLFALLVLGALRHRWLLAAIPMALLAVAIAVPSTVQRFDDLKQDQTAVGRPGNSLNARFNLWRENLPKVEQAPLLGHGFKSIVEEEEAHVHSDFVRAAVETGITGLVLFAWTMLAAVWGCAAAWRRTRRLGDRFLGAVALGSLASAAAFLLMTSDSNLMTQVAVAGTAWGILAAGHAAGRLARDEAAPA
jgi:O-antigen ligase